MHIKVGSRESRLAVIQSEMVIESIKKHHPEHEVELITMKTTGDIILDKTLDKIGGKGLFVKELDAALMEKRADITVHSCKDLPMEENPELPIVAYSKREDARDALVLPLGVAELDLTKPIGCSSKRRALQLAKIIPEATVLPVRGNVQTRLKKLDSGEFSALILASAGLKRLNLEDRISRQFSTEEMIPSAGQGILAIQCRRGFDASVVMEFDDKEGHACALAERAFVRRLDGGCSSPVAAFAEIKSGVLHLRGMDTMGNVAELSGDPSEAAELGDKLGKILLNGDAK